MLNAVMVDEKSTSMRSWPHWT